VSWVNRISNLFRRNQIDEELEEELQFHLDARTRHNLSAGMNAAAAQQDARRRFGNATLAKERTHEMNIMVSIETIGRDRIVAGLTIKGNSAGFTINRNALIEPRGTRILGLRVCNRLSCNPPIRQLPFSKQCRAEPTLLLAQLHEPMASNHHRKHETDEI
jgi:hypothetical protein